MVPGLSSLKREMIFIEDMERNYNPWWWTPLVLAPQKRNGRQIGRHIRRGKVE